MAESIKNTIPNNHTSSCETSDKQSDRQRYHDGRTKFGLCAYKCITPTECGILCTTTATWNFLPFFHRIDEPANGQAATKSIQVLRETVKERASASDIVGTSKFVMSVWHMKLSRSSNMIDTETALLSLCRLLMCVSRFFARIFDARFIFSRKP